MKEIFENPKLFSVIGEGKARLHNLRREIARRIWEARKSQIETVLEIDGDIRDLVSYCPHCILAEANILWHKYTSKILTIIKFKQYKHLPLGKNHALKSRTVIGAIQLPSNMIG